MNPMAILFLLFVVIFIVFMIVAALTELFKALGGGFLATLAFSAAVFVPIFLYGKRKKKKEAEFSLMLSSLGSEHNFHPDYTSKNKSLFVDTKSKQVLIKQEKAKFRKKLEGGLRDLRGEYRLFSKSEIPNMQTRDVERYVYTITLSVRDLDQPIQTVRFSTAKERDEFFRRLALVLDMS